MSDPTLPPPLPPPLPGAGRPWGFWATMGLGWAIVAVYFGAQAMLGGVFYGIAKGLHYDVGDPEDLGTNGLFLSVVTLGSVPVVLGGCSIFAFLRKGVTIRDYLGIKTISVRAFLPFVAGFVAMLVCFDVASAWMDQSIVTQFMIDIYESAGFKPLIWLTLVVGAPLGEETFFRGFLLPGFQNSRLGSVGAILLTSLLWAGIHTQYDLPEKSMIFMAGLMLGWVRVRFDSILPCMFLHALMNLLATLELLAIT